MGKASFSRLCTRKNVLHIRGRPSSFPLYIYREREREMGSSYTRCNSCQVTPFLHHRFLKDLTVKKDIIKCYCFPLLSLSLFIVFHLIKGPLTFSKTYFSNEPLNSLHPTHILLLLLFSLSLSLSLDLSLDLSELTSFSCIEIFVVAFTCQWDGRFGHGFVLFFFFLTKITKARGQILPKMIIQ